MTDDELEELTPAAQALCILMAEEIGVREIFSVNDMDVLISIGKGMFWSKQFDERARQLARDFERAVDNYNGDDSS